MVLSGLQDRLAPLQSWLFPRRVEVLLEDSAIALLARDGERIDWLEQVPLPEGLCRHGEPLLVEALGDLIGDLLVERGFAAARVRAVLPREAAAWRVLEWPDGRWPEQPELLVRQQQDELALPRGLQDADLQLDPLPGEPARSLLVAAPRSLLEGWIAVFSQAGVALDALEPWSIGLWRIASAAASPGLQVLLQLEHGQSWLLALEHGQPLGEWPLPPVAEREALVAALTHWRQHWQPTGGVVIAAEAMAPELLSRYGDALGCQLSALPALSDEPALDRAAQLLWQLDGGWDLLRQRRLERGLPPVPEPLVQARALLLRGGAMGGGLLAVLLLLWGAVLMRQGQVEAQLQGLRGIPAQVQALEARTTAMRRQLSGLQRSNEGLAKGLVAVASGSALVAQLAAMTPDGVQITDAQVQGSSLKLKGLAHEPQAFRRVNALNLLLAESPMFEAKTVRVLKLSRDVSAAVAGKAVPPVTWELTAGFATLAAPQQAQLLQRLGADGMARRLQILDRAGVLP